MMKQRLLRVAAWIGVKDELELIGPAIAHLCNIGVDRIVVHDMDSQDGTREWLSKAERYGAPGVDASCLKVFHLADEASGAEMFESIRQAVLETEADWFLMLDADEFPLPAGGDIRRCLAQVNADILDLPRYNVVLGPNGLEMQIPPSKGAYDNIRLYAHADPDFRSKLKEDHKMTYLCGVPQPKIALRPGQIGRRIGCLKYGMHGVLPGPEGVPQKKRAHNIIIAHVPLTSYPRLVKRVANIRAMFSLHGASLHPGFGWHWRRWLALEDAGTLFSEYARSHLNANELTALMASGTVRTAANLLAEDP